MNKKHIKIMTYNIHKGFGAGNLLFNLHEMKKNIILENPDLLFIQEILGQHDRKQKRLENWPELSQPNFIAEKNWPYFSYSKHADYPGGHHGNALFSKTSLSSIKHVTLSKYSRSSRGLVYGVVYPDNNNKAIHLICLHFGMLKRKRNIQVQSLIDLLSSLDQKEAIILAGDFNDWRETDTLHLEQKFKLLEVNKHSTGEYAKTYPAIKPILKNDRIYFKGLKLVESECLNYKPWKKLSDHLPLTATFAMD